MLLCEERRGKKITYANNIVLTGQWMGKEAVGWGSPLKSRPSLKHKHNALCIKFLKCGVKSFLCSRSWRLSVETLGRELVSSEFWFLKTRLANQRGL